MSLKTGLMYKFLTVLDLTVEDMSSTYAINELICLFRKKDLVA